MSVLNTGQAQISIGISSCLLGNKVRYDGGDRYIPELVKTLSSEFELIPYCPEVAIGMGIPRAPIQLVDINGVIHALGVGDPKRDMSRALLEYGNKTSQEIQHLSGFVLKRNSPSCGIGGVKVINENNQVEQRGQGLFVAQIMAHNPHLPVIDEVQFMDERLQQDFITAIHVYNARIKLP